MTFDQWWKTLETREQNRADKHLCLEAHQAGQLEAAEHILQMWRQPWGVTQKAFTTNLEEYVESLKGE